MFGKDKQIKMGFVVLHYNVKDVTELCISKILDLKNSDLFEIVIVDNASPNESGVYLQQKYKNITNIHVIISNENLGFAKGNNLGFTYLKNNFELDFMIVMNNDILINDINFVDKIYTIYNSNNFDVLGPDIYVPQTLTHQNPIRINAFCYEELIQLRDSLRYKVIFFCFFYFRHKFANFVRNFFRVNNDKRIISSKEEYFKKNDSVVMSKKNNFVLHGACYIFSSDFIKKRDYAFWPGTFMFLEEDVLQYECQKSNLKVIFSSLIQVIHLEDISTNSIQKTNYMKAFFKNRELYNSTIAFLNNFYKK